MPWKIHLIDEILKDVTGQYKFAIHNLMSGIK